MHISKYRKIPSLTGRSTPRVGGFVHLPLLIGTVLLVPLAYLFWPAMTAAANTVTTVANTMATVFSVCIWIAMAGTTLYLIRFAWKRKYLARLRDYWR